MLRIRRIFDDVLPANKETLQQVKAILRDRFKEVSEDEIESDRRETAQPFQAALSADTLCGQDPCAAS